MFAVVPARVEDVPAIFDLETACEWEGHVVWAASDGTSPPPLPGGCAAYPPDEAATLEKLTFRIENAPEYFWTLRRRCVRARAPGAARPLCTRH